MTIYFATKKQFEDAITLTLFYSSTTLDISVHNNGHCA